MANHDRFQQPPEGFGSDLELLMSLFAGDVWRGMSAEQAIEHTALHGVSIAPKVAAAIAAEADKTNFFRLLGRAMWNATPQPHQGFRLMKLPQPGRNDRCFCGSLRKFKQCCAQMPEFPIEPALMLGKLLGVMPRKHWADLAHSQAHRDWVLAVVVQWREEDDVESVAQLLEPWFQGDGAIPDQDAELLDLLLDAYLQLNKPRKRKSLAQAAIKRGGKEARYVGWQRMALMEMDAGNISASQAALKEAMRASPDNPDLALLDVQLLLAGGEFALARERAQFWLARLSRMRNPDLDTVMDWMRQIIANPQSALFNVAARSDAALKQLDALIARLPAPQCHYLLEPLEGSSGPLMLDDELARAMQHWSAVFPVQKSALTQGTSANASAWDDPEAWLALLAATPLLWQSFDVLDDVVCALDGYGMDGVAEELSPPLLAHAEALFALVTARFGAEGLKCEWAWMENRPALRLLVRKALDHEHAADAAQREGAFDFLCRMVRQLNPNDNHGLRCRVVSGLVQRGRVEEAIKVADAYPDDLADMQYCRALALFAAGRIKEADKEARQAVAAAPQIRTMLLAASPRRPNLDPFRYQLGSLQEAWLYREAHLDCWQAQPGALAWLKRISGR